MSSKSKVASSSHEVDMILVALKPMVVNSNNWREA